ncbi:curli polymerization inhibitor CsgI-related protein [Mannheimia massilioguelmaensis]|uniref:curli polymerization inhibitor CsgI-related protein n=1 Tax=Mannheimia massilioguelmaensis TaxID=1604354 RepID=UPI0005CB14EA|nr:DUF2057 domain-containing protein [Mannheimia massilioguelmaensis]
MKLRLTALAMTALLTSTATIAGVVTTSSNIEFVAIDGQKANKSLLKQAKSFEINDTKKHQVVVRVSEILRGAESGLFESDPIVVTFDGRSEDIQLSAPSLKNKRDIENFKASPKINVKTSAGADVANQQEYLMQEGFLPSVNLIDNLSSYNTSGAKAAVPALASTTMTTTMGTSAGKVAKSKVVVQGENAAEQMLQYWFQQADKETQTRFLNWAKKQ